MSGTVQANAELAYARLIEAVPYAAYLGIEIERSDKGTVFRLPFRPDLIGNPRLPALHGGVVAAFLELAMQLEVLVSQDQRRVPYPVDFSIDYWRTAKAQDMHATCRLIRHGRRVAQIHAECWQGDADRPVAFARADFMLRDIDTAGA